MINYRILRQMESGDTLLLDNVNNKLQRQITSMIYRAGGKFKISRYLFFRYKQTKISIIELRCIKPCNPRKKRGRKCTKNS